MKISYDVPCPCQEGTKGNKYTKQYEQVFHFMHSDAKEIEIEVENVRAFRSSCLKTLQYVYPQFKIYKHGKKALVVKTWQI